MNTNERGNERNEDGEGGHVGACVQELTDLH